MLTWESVNSEPKIGTGQNLKKKKKWGLVDLKIGIVPILKKKRISQDFTGKNSDWSKFNNRHWSRLTNSDWSNF